MTFIDLNGNFIQRIPFEQREVSQLQLKVSRIRESFNIRGRPFQMAGLRELKDFFTKFGGEVN